MSIKNDWNSLSTTERIDFISGDDEKLKNDLTQEAQHQGFLCKKCGLECNSLDDEICADCFVKGIDLEGYDNVIWRLNNEIQN